MANETALASAIDVKAGSTRAEAAYSALRDDIISGYRQPGERLRIERLSKLYSVGASPLREALQRLAADNFVIAVGNRGFTVAGLNAQEFEDLNAVRTLLELNAIRLSIWHGDAEWESLVAGAAYRLEKADRVLAAGDSAAMGAWEQANDKFHLATVAACGSIWLLKLRATVNDQCARYRRASVALRRSQRDLCAEHKAIAEAVLSRDTEKACALVESHFLVTTKILLADLRA